MTVLKFSRLTANSPEIKEQVAVAQDRVATLRRALSSTTRANPKVPNSYAVYLTDIYELDGEASYELLNANKNSLACFAHPTKEVAAKARAQMLAALSTCQCAEGPLHADFGLV